MKPFSELLKQKITLPGSAERAALANTLLEAAVVLAACLTLFWLVQYSTPALFGVDGYYHMKLAYLMRHEGLRIDFIWLPMSIARPEVFSDPHLLYHVYLALFVPADPVFDAAALVTGAKIASMVLPSLAFLAIWWLLRGQGVRYAWLWVIALFALSEVFLFRMSMPRAQSGSLLILVLGVHWLLKDRVLPLIPLAFAYVWFYNAFPLLLMAALVVAFATLLTERRVTWQPIVAILAGFALGLLINPYFPNSLTFFITHILPKVGETGSRVGVEWWPYESWTLFRNSTGALVITALGVFAVGWQRRRFDRATLALFGLTLVTGLFLLKARRFTEYFVPFTLAFSALAISPLLAELEARWAERGGWARWRQVLTAAGLALLLAFPLARSIERARGLGRAQPPVEKYAAAARWLAENSPEGSLIFQIDWDDFTRLFFHNTHNIYTIGLDTTWMEEYDIDLFNLWVSITRGQVEQPSGVIASRFGGAYVFSDLEHPAFERVAAEDPYLTEVYRDHDSVIWRVEPGAAP